MFPRIHLSIERWRKNSEYGVWVSNQGNIKLIKNKQTLNPRINDKGYCMVFTELGAVYVHRLVAYTWLGGKRNAKYNVDHINSNKRDNSVRNLRWVTKEVNLAYAAYTQCNVTEQTCIEEKEDILSILFNKNLLDEQRHEELKTLLNNQKIRIKFHNNIINSYEQLVTFKNEKINKCMSTDQFVKRILMAAEDNTCVYCGGYWKIEVI